MNILILPYSHTLSHVSRPLVIASELKRRGHEVTFAGESSKVKLILQEGFRVIPVHEPNPVKLYGNIRAGKMKFIDNDELQRMIDADLSLYAEHKPDLVLTDGRFSAPISTQIYGIKHAAIVNVSSTEYRALPYVPFFERIPDWLITRDSALWRNLESLNLRLEMFIFDNGMSIFSRLSKKLRLKKTITATNCLTGNDLTLLPDIPEYFPTKNLPDNYHYIGPLTWKSTTPPPPWWPPTPDDRPFIYVSMGTTGIEDFFHRVYDLIKNSEMSALITTGGQASLETYGNKIFVEEFIDGDIAIDACDLVVCHGGNGTIYQALQHGKPIIGIPTIPDQKFNMRRVESLGLGKTISWEDFSLNPSILLENIRDIRTNNNYTQNAMKFGNLLQRLNPATSAGEIIEKQFTTK